MKFISEKKITLLYFLAACITVFVLVLFYYNTQKVKSTNKLVEHTEDILRTSDNVLMDMLNIVISARGYLLTENVTFLGPYYKALNSVNGNLAKLAELTKDNPGQQSRIDSLKNTTDERIDIIKHSVEQWKGLNEPGKEVLIKNGNFLNDKIRFIIADINTEEFRLLKQRKIDSEKNNKNSGILFFLFFIVVFINFILIIVNRKNQKIRNKFAEELKQSNELFSNLFNYNPASLVIYRLSDGKIINVNNSFLQLVGFTLKEEAIGKTFDELNVFVNPNYGKEILELLKVHKVVQDFETRIQTRQGLIKWISASVLFLEVDHTKCLFSVSIDITDRKKAEVQLEAVNKALELSTSAQKLLSGYSLSLIEASRDPLFTISTEGKITDINNASINITEQTREQLIGTDFFEYFTEPIKAREIYKQVFAKGFVADYPLTIRDGKLTEVLFNGSVYKDADGKVVGVVVVARDITDHNRIERELIEAKVFAELATELAIDAKGKAESATQIAQDAVKSKQQFLSNMSHEIRTPMNAIIGFTKVLLKTGLTVKQKEYLTAIKLSGDALTVLINDILDLAKVDAGKMTFEQTPFKMALSISAMIHLFETKIQEKNLQLIKKYDNKIPKVLVGDPVRLHQIILNLLSNAVKFTTKGKITVSAQLLSEDDEKATIEFAVIDTGIGIAASKIEHIFENFQQATSGTSRLYGGTGLGLAIAKQLVESQGGTIVVKSKPDEGSTFSFILPFKKTEDEAELETEIIKLDVEIKNIKVLVVEDIALNQLLMKTLLDDFGFEHDIATNGKVAIEKLQNKPYDIILMDLQMPEMNGFEATEYIRNKLNSHIPIIALTADVTTTDLDKCKAVGMNDYIAKPVDEKLLYSKMIDLLKKPKIKKDATNTQNENTKDNRTVSNGKCIDLTYMHNRTKSNPALMTEMISLYLKQTPPLIENMRQSLFDKNWDLLYAAVHKMIPSFSLMGINKDFEDTAKKIQNYASSKEHLDEIQELALQLEIVCNQACAELEDELTKIKIPN
jgi:PAS domain S-box-containing protein